jgi:RNA polymerase sigma-70 factor, ECF subfamily
MSKTRTNQEWLQDLVSDGIIQETAIADLRDLLLRATLYFFSRNVGDFQNLKREETLQRAEDCAQDALIAVLDHLAEFRGESKFTTWAYKFAINIALVAARRERWKRISLDELDTSKENKIVEKVMRETSREVTPERSALQTEAQRVIVEVIQQELTDRQRQVVLMMVFYEVPLDEVARHLGSNRNAVYKLLHDARRKIKKNLEQRGFDVKETLSLFSPSR